MFLNYRRIPIAYIMLSIFTLGLYSAYFRAEVARDLNTAFGEKRQEIPGAKFVILNILSFGVYATLWDIGFLKRCGEYIEQNGQQSDIDLESYRFYGAIPFVRFITVSSFISQINSVCRIYSDKQLEDVDVHDYVEVNRVRELTEDVDKIYSASAPARKLELDFSEEKKEDQLRERNNGGRTVEIDQSSRKIAGYAVVEEYDPSRDQRRIGYQLRFAREDKTASLEAEELRLAEEERKRKLEEQLAAEKRRQELAATTRYRSRRWLAKTVCFLLLAFVMPFAVIAVTVFAIPPVYDETYMGALSEKYEMLKENKDSKKIIVVGGSSVALGLDSELMKNELRGYDVVNFGLSSELGIKAMLDLSRVGIGKDDIIVIAPEMSDRGMSLYFNGSEMLKALDGNLGLLMHIESEDYTSMLGASLEFTGSKLLHTVSGTKPENSRPAYTKESIDEYGDNVYGRPFNETLGIYNSVHFNYKAKLDDAEITEYDRFISYINEYVYYAQRKGATVYYSFSPICSDAIAENVDASAIADYYSNLRSVLKCEVISDINNYIMDAEYFYDSEFTLNDAGVNARTVKLIDDIKRIKEMESRTDSDDDINPTFLNVPPVIETEEDAINALHFIFEPYELSLNGETVTYYSIVGLTELGKEVQEFTVPNMYNGAPVVRIAPYAFKDSKMLKTVHLGATTSIIDEYAFASSTVTEVYVPDGKNPYDIRIPTYSKLAIEGADPRLLFYVSEKQIELFKNDTGFWANYKEYLAVKPE